MHRVTAVQAYAQRRRRRKHVLKTNRAVRVQRPVNADVLRPYDVARGACVAVEVRIACADPADPAGVAVEDSGCAGIGVEPARGAEVLGEGCLARGAGGGDRLLDGAGAATDTFYEVASRWVAVGGSSHVRRAGSGACCGRRCGMVFVVADVAGEPTAAAFCLDLAAALVVRASF